MLARRAKPTEALEAVGLRSRRLLSLRDTERAMSQENVEIVRRATEARNKRDLDAALRNFHPDVELDMSESRAAASGMVESVVRGRAQVRARLLEFLDAWENVTWQLEEITEAGEDRLVVVVRVTGRGTGSGANVEQRNGQVWTFGDGKIARVDSYMGRTEAFEAAGLSE